MSKDDLTKRLIRQAFDFLNAISKTVEQLKAEMLKLAAQLPEYPVVMEMRGVGDSLRPQLMAEIGDVTRFVRRSSITSFADVDPGADQSGNHEAKKERPHFQERSARAAQGPFSGVGQLAEIYAPGRSGLPVHGQETH